ncbi:MAG TPA: 4Fe-4S dicluster domain-containing protein [Thermomicrobiales bacterium]
MIEPTVNPPSVIERGHLRHLFTALIDRNFEVVGPTVRDGAIVYDRIGSPDDLPVGWTDRQDGGTYRLARRDDAALFGYAVGPHSWKRYLFPPDLVLWRAKRTDANGGFAVEQAHEDAPRYAFFGVRACELQAIAVQDRVFVDGPFVDPVYRARREQAFLVAVNCGHPAGTCFCVSMNSGPRATSGFDLALTEVIANDRHYFTVEVGTDRGADVLRDVPHRPATAGETAAADRVVELAAGQMGRQMETGGIKELLYRNAEHPRWAEVAGRCLTCGNCTMVCPTCFCATVEDSADLTGETAERVRRWDSCFALDHSFIHGGSVRSAPASRYRQWLTHKLGSWIDQFGTSGCVGCGRCITWCPVGIDITEEVRAIRATDGAGTTEKEDGNG